MGFAMPSESELQPTDRLSEPGWFHVAINDFDPEAKKKDGTFKDKIKFETSVLDGTVESQKKRSLIAEFRNPNLSDKDNGRFAWNVQVRIAKCLGGVYGRLADGREMLLDQIPAKTQIENIVWIKKDANGNVVSTPVGKQLIFKVVPQTNADGTIQEGWFEVQGLHIYHPGDPDKLIAHVPRDMQALEIAGIKWTPPANTSGNTTNQQKPTGTNGNGNGASGNAQPPKTTAGPDLDDIDF